MDTVEKGENRGQVLNPPEAGARKGMAQLAVYYAFGLIGTALSKKISVFQSSFQNWSR